MVCWSWTDCGLRCSDVSGLGRHRLWSDEQPEAPAWLADVRLSALNQRLGAC